MRLLEASAQAQPGDPLADPGARVQSGGRPAALPKEGNTMKLTDLEIAQAKVRDWKDARAALLEIKGISMAVSVMRESKSPGRAQPLDQDAGRLITPAVEAYIAELRLTCSCWASPPFLTIGRYENRPDRRRPAANRGRRPASVLIGAI